MEYDAFISYARGKGTPVARALRGEISRYNKKWNQGVSSKIYFDEKSLGPGSSLDDALKSALLRSRRMIVVLSRRAAEEQSWVNKEVKFWLENKKAEDILLVLAEGSLAWEEGTTEEGGGFSQDSDCVPSVLRRGLKVQPVWVDMSWFTAPRECSDPRFQDAVISLYSAVHGISPDEARAANDKTVRRNRSLAKGAIASLSVLLVLSVLSSFVAMRQTRVAEDRERTALSLALAARARSLASENIRVASLLALQAYETVPSRETKEALHEVVASAPKLVRMDVMPQEPSFIAAPESGDPLLGTRSGDVYRWLTEEGRFEKLFSVPAEGSGSVIQRISADRRGNHLLVQFGDALDGSCILWSDGRLDNLGGCRTLAMAPDGRSYIRDATLYDEFGVERNIPYRAVDELIQVEFSWFESSFVSMRFDGSWERRSSEDPSSVVEASVEGFGNPNHGSPVLAPGAEYQTFEMGADDAVSVRRLRAGNSVEYLSSGISNPRVVGLSPGGEFLYAGGPGNIRLSTGPKERSSAVSAGGVSEVLEGLGGIQFVTMVGGSFVLGASETHIALWDVGQRSRIVRSAPMPSGVSGGLHLGLRPAFSPDSSHVALCYNGVDVQKMLVIRLRDMHVMTIDVDDCVFPRWTDDSRFVAASDVGGVPKVFFDVRAEFIDGAGSHELRPSEEFVGQNLHEFSETAHLIRESQSVRVVDNVSEATLLSYVEPLGLTSWGEPLTGSGLSPNGEYFFTASIPWEERGVPGLIQVWLVDTKRIMEETCRTAMTPLSPDEWSDSVPGVAYPREAACA